MKFSKKFAFVVLITIITIVSTSIPAMAWNQPYNWQLWDGSKLDFSQILKIESGYAQDPVSISYYPNTLKAISTKYATVLLEASGGLQKGYDHTNNLGLAPYAFAWSESITPPTQGETIYKGYTFNGIDWFMAGEMIDGVATVSDVLDVNEAIDRIINAVDIHGDGTPDSDREKALKEYMEGKRLQLGKTYYFHVFRFGGNALFATVGFRPGVGEAEFDINGKKINPTNFVSSDIKTSTPITMPAAAVTFTVNFESNGGSICQGRLITKDQTVPKPADPVKEGSTFAGWYTSPELTSKFDFSTPITTNMILYAKWDTSLGNAYTVAFNTIGGSNVPSQIVSRGMLPKKPDDPTNFGYKFAGWFSDRECTVPYNFDKPVTVSITVYGWWIEEKYDAKPTDTKFMINDKEVSLPAYMINGSNYVKMRDVAALLVDRFDVRWENGKARLYNKTTYTKTGGELVPLGSETKIAIPTQTNFAWGLSDAVIKELNAYNIENNNYVSLRDIAKLFDFDIDWHDGKAWIEPQNPYTDDKNEDFTSTKPVPMPIGEFDSRLLSALEKFDSIINVADLGLMLDDCHAKIELFGKKYPQFIDSEYSYWHIEGKVTQIEIKYNAVIETIKQNRKVDYSTADLDSRLLSAIKNRASRVEIADLAISSNDIGNLASLFKCNYPEYSYYVNLTCWVYSNTSLHITFDYMYSAKEVEQYNKQLEAKVDAFFKTIPANTIQYEKIRLLNLYLGDTITYNKYIKNNSSQISGLGTPPDSSNIYTLLCLLTGDGVCAGYTSAFEYISERMGIEDMSVTGFVWEIVPDFSDNYHSWNIVKIDGKWYHVDSTWNDQDGNWTAGNPEYEEKYLLKSDEYMKSHEHVYWYLPAQYSNIIANEDFK